LKWEDNTAEICKSASIRTCIVVAALSPLGQYIIHQFITPSYFPNAIAYSVNNDVMDQAEAEKYFTLKNYIVQSVMGAVIMGIITSAIVALLVRKK